MTIASTKIAVRDLLVERLTKDEHDLRRSFLESAQHVGVRHCVIDDLLPLELADAIADAFPDGDRMRLMSSFRERKYTSKAFESFDPLLSHVTFAFQDPQVVKIIENITGIADQVPDSLLYAGGLSAMANGHFLSPHIDNSHDSSRQYYRTLNLLYYVTPNWDEANGGNLQLWDRTVDKNVTIHSRFNRLVLMETTPSSWHSVNEVRAHGLRKCVSNYYFSRRSPTGEEYFNITAFSAPPSQPLLRMWSKIDAGLRQLARRIRPDGFGPVDVYEGPPR